MDDLEELEDYEDGMLAMLTTVERDMSFNKKFSVLCQKWINTARRIRER